MAASFGLGGREGHGLFPEFVIPVALLGGYGRGHQRFPDIAGRANRAFQQALGDLLVAGIAARKPAFKGVLVLACQVISDHRRKIGPICTQSPSTISLAGRAIDARASARLNRINLKNKSFSGGARPYER